jgi:hypothetical protein
MSGMKDYESFWGRDLKRYVLVELTRDDRPPDYVIFDIENASAVLIEDEAIHEEVVRRMLKAGAIVTDDVPEGCS